MPVPNIAQHEIHGKFVDDEISTRKRIEIIKFSSEGKNKESAVMQITHAFGFTN